MVAVPDEFDLIIQRKQTSYRARMIWRRADEAGVAFVAPAAAIETQKAALKQRVGALRTAD